MKRAKPAAPPRDLGIEAYLKLKEAIRDGGLASGTRITETELSERFKMSRTPVREAIYRLESEGLLTHEPRRGLTVTRPDHQMMMELYAMREALEGTAARFAAQHAADLEIEALAELVMSEPDLKGDPKALSQTNQKIHGLICLAAHNRYLLRSLEIMTSTTSLLPTMLGDPTRANEAHAEHLAILKAIRARDPEAAEAAARAHIISARKRRLGLLMLAEDFSL